MSRGWTMRLTCSPTASRSFPRWQIAVWEIVVAATEQAVDILRRTDSAKPTRRPQPVTLDSAEVKRAMKDAEIITNTPVWQTMLERAESAVSFVNETVKLWHETQPKKTPPPPPRVPLPPNVPNYAEHLVRRLLRPLLDEDTVRDDLRVTDALDAAAATADGESKAGLVELALGWMDVTGMRPMVITQWSDLRASIESRMRVVKGQGVDTDLIEVALLEHDHEQAEALLVEVEQHLADVREVESLRRSLARIDDQLNHLPEDADPSLGALSEEARNLLQGGDLVRARDIVARLRAAIKASHRSGLLVAVGLALNDLRNLGAAPEIVAERQKWLTELETDPVLAVGPDDLDALKDQVDQLRVQLAARVRMRTEAARQMVDDPRERVLLPEDAQTDADDRLDRVEVLVAQDRLAAALQLAEEVIELVRRRRVHPWTSKEGEAALLAHLQDYLSQHANFSTNDILRLYVALKTRPFVILAGLTGSGKSSIARLFAEALNVSVANGRFLRVAVRPDWIDQSETLGYVNPLSGRFEAGWLALIVRACQREPDRIHVVLLDEMNLAPVEQYMAEFLSALEEARAGAVDVTIRLYSAGAEPTNKTEWPPALPFPPNLFLLGTVNVDETTRALSDRVLDRANVLQLSVAVTDAHHNPSRLGQWPTWDVPFSEWQLLRQDPGRDDHAFLVELTTALAGMRIGVGMRAHLELERFVANARGVLHHNDALDLGLLQRIIPKIKGFKRDLNKLDKVRALLEMAGASRCVDVVDAWLDPSVSDDEFLDGTDARIGLIGA